MNEIDHKKYVIDAPLPEATDSYTVISHGSVIQHVTDLITENGFKIIKEIYKYNNAAQIACGIYYLSHQTDEELGMLFTWTNSYNKQVRFKCSVGAYVKVSGNILISNNDEGAFFRKHTGNADDEVRDVIAYQLNTAMSYYDELVLDKQKMKKIDLGIEKFAEIVGRLYLHDRLISTEQISTVYKEIKNPSFQYDCGENCAWTLYNYLLTAILRCHPNKWAEQQRVIHIFMKNELKIGNYTPLKQTEKKVEKEHNLEVKAESDYDIEKSVVTEKINEDLPFIDIEEPGLNSPDEPTNSETSGSLVISKIDLHQLHPGAELGSVVYMEDHPYIIDRQTENEFILLKAIIEESEEPELILPIIENPSIIMPTLDFRDIEILPPAGLSAKELEDIHSKISQEILNLYGSSKPFNYIRLDSQYNVVLQTGESFTMFIN